MTDTSYCTSLFRYERFPTRKVKIGSLAMGGDEPIRVQSMTTTDTMNTAATVAQSTRMIEAGCELVRITAPSRKEAENLALIRDELRSRGYNAPLVADIHFTPNAAEIAAGIVEKVRVNPGNYADKKKFEEIEYTDEAYGSELERIRQRFTPLVELCKKNGTAMRIGTNHGSLSDRILSRYGDTPLGMVESAMEFIRICRELSFHDIVISMKASNTLVMVQAYRLLVHTMMKEGMNYPLHLGVTEAGDGEDGRIKSAVGIGTLLEDGLGDTVRVSLTEEPEAEIPVAAALVKRYATRANAPEIVPVPVPVNPFDHIRRQSRQVGHIGNRSVPCVIADLSHRQEISAASLFAVGYQYSVPLDKWNISDLACDFIYTGNKKVNFEIPGSLGVVQDAEVWRTNQNAARHYPLFNARDYNSPNDRSAELNFIRLSSEELDESMVELLRNDHTAVVILTTTHAHGMADQRAVFFRLMNAACDVPVIICRSYRALSEDEFILYSSTDVGALLVDGLGDGILISSPETPILRVNSTSFGILQATRTRISKTEYISCPSCGRTLFDLQETTARIRSRTSHLKGVKIGIMGCIVNGPGEMADADYGYVGTGPGENRCQKECA
jgi:(E)-4-hydroxy-3-methylbut-2-enyl-diphosphate synthase